MNSIFNIIKKAAGCMLVPAYLCCLASCDYLDVIPDNITTIDHAFASRKTAEEFLYGCYSFRPAAGMINEGDADPALGGGDETWQRYIIVTLGEAFDTWPSSRIARGEQNATSPILNRWNVSYEGIHDCNVFLERIGGVHNLDEFERTRWIAEAKFLKAYYHHVLFKRYGPVPIVDVNLPVSASVEEVKVYRNTVDEVVNYIANLLDEAGKDLPLPREVLEGTEAGRADKLSALALKAELLLFAASDLFNGNTEMASVVDNRGVQLFPQDTDPEVKRAKWERAVQACDTAIAAAHAYNKALYTTPHSHAVTEGHPPFIRESIIRGAVTERWNNELIWGNTKFDHYRLTRVSSTTLIAIQADYARRITGEWAPTLKMASMYYSSNGVPIEEDKDWISNGWYDDRYKLREEPSASVNTDEKFYVRADERTAYLHYNREPRFYASIAFDKCIYWGNGWYDFETDVKSANFLLGGVAGYQGADAYSISGYNVKKMAHPENTQSATANSTEVYFPFPIFRLADLYLMYAEAVNEAEGPNGPRSDRMFDYLYLIRERAGLPEPDVKSAWQQYSNNPDKPTTQEGLRDIIRRERTIELAFEGKRFWDLRRWKKIDEFNVSPQGWNIMGETPEDFYNPVNLPQVPLKFTVKDYFWPIRESDLYVNKNLVQNYGW